MAHLVTTNARVQSIRGKELKYEKRGEEEFAMRYEKTSKVEPGLEFWACATKPVNPATGKRCGGRASKQPGSDSLTPNLSSPHWHRSDPDDRLVTASTID